MKRRRIQKSIHSNLALKSFKRETSLNSGQSVGFGQRVTDSQAVQQSIEAEWQKDQDDSIDLEDQNLEAHSLPAQTQPDQSERSPQLKDQPGTLNFMSSDRCAAT